MRGAHHVSGGKDSLARQVCRLVFVLGSPPFDDSSKDGGLRVGSFSPCCHTRDWGAPLPECVGVHYIEVTDPFALSPSDFLS